MNLEKEISRRRIFAIISHPDAGKTTLTEKLLLFGGAIQTAGAVRSNKIRKTATSDFMEIEKQRGISVATSVMGFEYGGIRVNILDTPGHKDFAEDTYRTLSAVDSVILVVDSVKGVEEQTEKLMQVCRMRNTPVIIFINKLDREGREAFDLLDELENKLDLHVCPMTWPIGKGQAFQGVYDVHRRELNLFDPNKTGISDRKAHISDPDAPELAQHIGERPAVKLREDLGFLPELYETFDRDLYLEGLLAPVFFGSALNNFGVKELLETFLEIAPPPQGRPAAEREVRSEEKKMTGFVFKIHANLDPNHRDRIAFLRICSGRFLPNTFYFHTRLGKKLKFANPATFMANEKIRAEEAWPGDVVGLYDSGNFKIGDTLTEGEELHFMGIPSFSPEIFRELENRDPFRSKQLEKGILQLTEEGVAQLFIQQPGNRKIVGTVGELQFDVIQFRLEHEYGAKCSFHALPYYKAFWIAAERPSDLEAFLLRKAANIGYDRDGRPVFFAGSEWVLKVTRDNFPALRFHTMSDFDHPELYRLAAGG
jgi:peptide chain release factor 3